MNKNVQWRMANMLKKSINSANSIVIHVNALLILGDIQEELVATCRGSVVPQIMELFQHIHHPFCRLLKGDA
jgi:hypothetical protein